MKAALDVLIDGGVMRSYRFPQRTAGEALLRLRRSAADGTTQSFGVAGEHVEARTADEPRRGQASIESCWCAVGWRDPAGFTGSGSVVARRTIGKASSAIT